MGFHFTDAVFNIRVTELEAEADGKKVTLPYTGIDHAVLNALANRANNETGKCWPGYGLLAEDTHFSRRAVMRAAVKLEKFGLITSEFTTDRNTNTYTLHMDRLVAASLLTPAKNKGKSKNLAGKYTRKKLDLYPSDFECDKCGTAPTACSCIYPCEQEKCLVVSGSLAGHLHHSYVRHRLKLQPVAGSESMQLCPTDDYSHEVPGGKEEEEIEFLDESKATSFDLDDADDDLDPSKSGPAPVPVVSSVAELGDIRDWSEDKFGISGQRLANCIIYQLDHAKNPYIRNSGVSVASMGREKFVTMLDSNTPPGWTPENHGKRKPTKVETDKDRETREYYERIHRLKELKDVEGLCKCGSSDFACKCVSAAYHAEMEAHA
jgi:hypothetical protein